MAKKPVGNLAALGFQVRMENKGSAPKPEGATEIQKPTQVTCFWNEIPQELKELSQWVNWKYVLREGRVWDKIPFDPKTNKPASSTDSATWANFGTAVQQASNYDGIGFVLVEGGGLVIIDLDDKPSNPAQLEELQFFTEVISNFATYTELSVGGSGAHIVCRGNLPPGVKGRRTGHIEVYSAERYLTFTGNTDLSNLRFVRMDLEDITEVTNCQTELNYLMGKLGHATGAARSYSNEEIDVTETKTLDDIWTACSTAENKDKFLALWDANWECIGHHDHSLADMQLMEFFRFAGATIAQTIQMHSASQLACEKRTDKKKHHTYPMRTARKVFSIGHQERESARLMQQQAEELAANFAQHNAVQAQVEPIAGNSESAFELEYPPGQMGNVARMFYSQSPIPNKQIATVAALAYMAGVAGLNWQTPTKAGLNINVIIVAASGLGKEAATDLPMKLFNDTVRAYMLPDTDVPFFTGAMASGQAMVKTLAKKRCFVHHRNEIGRLFREWNNDRNPVVASVKEALLILYPKSACNSTMGGMNYSDKESNIEDPGPCAMSLVGDVTPNELFPNIQFDSATDGGLSRMEFVQVYGDRPNLNYNAMHAPFQPVLEWNRALLTQSMHLRNNEQFCFVQFADEAAQNEMIRFGEYCTTKVNLSPEGFVRQAYNRAYIRALKYGSLCAVADNPYYPAMTTLHVRWSIEMVLGGIQLFENRVTEGDVGIDDEARKNRLLKIISKYLAGELVSTATKAEAYAITPKMWEMRLISTSTFGRMTSNFASFKNHPLGANAALKQALEHLVRCGVLVQLDRAALQSAGFSTQAILYRVVSLLA